MMPYETKDNRKQIYLDLIRQIDAGLNIFMCLAIKDLTNVFPEVDTFPEFWKQCPKLPPGKMVWFEDSKRGMQSRKRVLLKMIELCDKQ